MIDISKKTLILGAYGRIGKQIVQQMDEAGYNILYPTHRQCDMMDHHSYEWYFHENKPEYVINLIGKTTNINLCTHYPATICKETVQMNINVLDMCRKYEVKKLVNIVSSCAYGANSPILKEEEFWNDTPHESIRPHGLAKRMVYFLGTSYAKQFHMNIVTVALNNLYGGCSWEHPTSLKFLDSLIVKIVDAKLFNYKTVEIWGSGKPLREVIYSQDAAKGILQVFDKYDSPELLNIGTGLEYSITQYAELIANIVRWKGVFAYLMDKPDGQYRKLFSKEKMSQVLQWYPPTNIIKGIEETVASYKQYAKTKERKSYRIEE